MIRSAGESRQRKNPRWAWRRTFRRNASEQRRLFSVYLNFTVSNVRPRLDFPHLLYGPRLEGYGKRARIFSACVFRAEETVARSGPTSRTFRTRRSGPTGHRWESQLVRIIRLRRFTKLRGVASSKCLICRQCSLESLLFMCHSVIYTSPCRPCAD